MMKEETKENRRRWRHLEKIRREIEAIGTAANRVRAAGKILKQFSIADLEELIIKDPAWRIRNTVGDLKKSGEIVHHGRGLYEYAGKKKKRTYMDVIWHLVRSHRHFRAEEIERLSGAKRYTVNEYLWCLRGLGYLRKAGPGAWLLIKDPGPKTPVNTAKCQKLKEIRRAQRASAFAKASSSASASGDKSADKGQ